MSAIPCPKCGALRKVENAWTPDGWQNPACENCGDPGWLNPGSTPDSLEGYPKETARATGQVIYLHTDCPVRDLLIDLDDQGEAYGVTCQGCHMTWFLSALLPHDEVPDEFADDGRWWANLLGARCD